MHKPALSILLLVTTAVLAPVRAGAQVSRCVAADGSATYTDGSCRALGGQPVPMSANLMRNLAREGLIGGDANFRPTGIPPVVAAAAAEPKTNRLGAATCPRTPTQLATALRSSLGGGEVSKLASLYDWAGMSSRQARPVLQRLERMSERPLIDGQYFSAADAPGSGGTVQLVQGSQAAPTVTEIAVNRRAGCLLLAL